MAKGAPVIDQSSSLTVELDRADVRSDRRGVEVPSAATELVSVADSVVERLPVLRCAMRVVSSCNINNAVEATVGAGTSPLLTCAIRPLSSTGSSSRHRR
jgi:hypothetical protein